MKKLTRREFYDLVWSKPMTELAKEFGLSDVALHKICKRRHIPPPGMGYWPKLLLVSPLPKLHCERFPKTQVTLFALSPSRMRSLSPEVQEAYAKAKAALKEGLTPSAVFASDDLHSSVKRMKRKFEKPQKQKRKCIDICEPEYFSVSIAPTSTARLIGILNSLVKAAEERGLKSS